jgi:filamentous hemagglutinin family protein
MDASSSRLRRPDSIGQAFLWAFLPTLALVLIVPPFGDAQVTTSITSTTGAGNLGTTVTQAGNLYHITGGTRPGGVTGTNLFHSFGDFSVGAGDTGNFLNDTGLPTSNILGRITGGNVSNIYGTIQTTDFGNANLFLVNPSGIVVGPNGSVNVGGSVSFSTAQYLRLFDSLNGGSANFYANPASDGLANSVLAVSPVVDFGFLSPAAYGFLTAPDSSATITVQGSCRRKSHHPRRHTFRWNGPTTGTTVSTERQDSIGQYRLARRVRSASRRIFSKCDDTPAGSQ